MLAVHYAFHSAQMAPFQHQLLERLGVVRTASPTVSVYSTVTGGLAKDVRFDAAYFGRNVRDPVQFAGCINAMAEDGCDVFIEIGPQPVLASSIAECLSTRERAPAVLASLRRGRPERETLLQSCAGAYAAGCDLDWEHVQPTIRSGCRIAELSMAAKAPLDPSAPDAWLGSAGRRASHARAPNSGGRNRRGDF